MTGHRAKAHGRASHAVVRWLHGRRVGAVSLHRPLDDDDAREPTTSDQIEEAVRCGMADAVGAMLHVGGKPADHLTTDRPDMQRALYMAGALPGDDPVDHLERLLGDLCATLHSPKIKRAIAALAGALLSPPHSLSAAAVSTILDRSFRAPLAPGEAGEAYPRTMHITGMRQR
jgi:hypothetical protein